MDSRASMLDLGGAIMMYPFFSEWRTKHGSNTNGHAPKLGICKLTYEYIYIDMYLYTYNRHYSYWFPRRDHKKYMVDGDPTNQVGLCIYAVRERTS